MMLKPGARKTRAYLPITIILPLRSPNFTMGPFTRPIPLLPLGDLKTTALRNGPVPTHGSSSALGMARITPSRPADPIPTGQFPPKVYQLGALPMEGYFSRLRLLESTE